MPAKTVKLTKAEQRVATARHALGMIRRKKFKPKAGHYLHANKPLKADLDGDAKTALTSVVCSGCAQGSLLLSHILQHNRLTLEDIGAESSNEGEWSRLTLRPHQPDCQRGLGPHWTKLQLRLIEHYFEGPQALVDWDPVCRGHPHTEVSCGLWHEVYPKDYDRLVAILKNIIRNQGTFKPNDCAGCE